MMYISDSCIDRMYAMIAACYDRAFRDARRGNKGAIDFLDVTAPDWRERVSRPLRLRSGAAADEPVESVERRRRAVRA